MAKQPFTYIMANYQNGAVYTGVTSGLMKRVKQHRDGTFGGFTKRYDCKRLVWFEAHEVMEAAITREKAIKNWPRKWKLELIETDNPRWRDLAEDLGFNPLPPPSPQT